MKFEYEAHNRVLVDYVTLVATRILRPLPLYCREEVGPIMDPWYRLHRGGVHALA